MHHYHYALSYYFAFKRSITNSQTDDVMTSLKGVSRIKSYLHRPTAFLHPHRPVKGHGDGQKNEKSEAFKTK